MAGEVRVRLLGTVEARRGDVPVVLTAPLQRALLACLALAAARTVPLGAIVDALWVSPPDSAVNAVQQYVAALRRVLGRGAVLFENGGYRLAVDPRDVDVVRFSRLITEAHAASRVGETAPARRKLAEALSMWDGEPLSGLPDAPFVGPSRADLRADRDRAEMTLLRLMVEQGDAGTALPQLEALACERPLDEAVSALLVRALGMTSRPAEALAVFERARSRMAEELGLDPGEELLAAQASVLRRDASPSPDGLGLMFPPLPRQRSSLIGRDAAVAEVSRLLAEPDTSLVTVTGPGGIGKTSLALEVAHRETARRPVLWLDLAALTRPIEVMPELAAQVSVKDPRPEQIAERVASVLRGSGALVVLDNFEHLTSAGRQLGDLIDALDPSVHILVTSRIPLNLRGERRFLVGPLPTASGSGARPAAVELFLARSHELAGRWRQTEEVLIAELCARLDGMPLAIELAAARAHLIPVDELIAGLEHNLDVLAVGPEDAPARHRSLRACVAWSIDQLTDQERWLLHRLSVFVGGAEMAAIQSVAGRGMSETELIELLDSLARASLLWVVRSPGHRRFLLLETIRVVAREAFGGSEAWDEAAAAHAQHYLGAFAHAELGLPWPPRTRAEFDSMSNEIPNALAAIRWFEAQSRPDEAAALVTGLCPVWSSRGDFADAALRLRRVIETGGCSPQHRSIALRWLSIQADRVGDRGRRIDLLEECLSIEEADYATRALALGALGEDARMRGDPATAAAYFSQAIAVAADDHELRTILECESIDAADAVALLAFGREAIETARAHSNEVLERNVKRGLSSAAASSVDARVWELGVRWGDDAAALAEAWGDMEDRAMAMSNAAACELLASVEPRVTHKLEDALRWSVRLRNVALTLETLVRLAASWSAEGRAFDAAGLARAALRLAAEHGYALSEAHQPLLTRYVDGLRDQLGEEVYIDAQTRWSHLDLEYCAERASASPP